MSKQTQWAVKGSYLATLSSSGQSTKEREVSAAQARNWDEGIPTMVRCGLMRGYAKTLTEQIQDGHAIGSPWTVGQHIFLSLSLSINLTFVRNHCSQGTTWLSQNLRSFLLDCRNPTNETVHKY
jgi:hypothetical protein